MCAVEPGLSKLLVNDVLQFSGLDPSKELTVQIALEKFRSDHGAGDDVDLFPFSWGQHALPALGKVNDPPRRGCLEPGGAAARSVVTLVPLFGFWSLA